MPKGGARKGAGRKTLKPESPLADGNKDFATRVLARIGKGDWLRYADIKLVKSDEDYALHVLVMGKGATDQFNKLLDRKYGRSLQQVRIANPEGERFKVEIDLAVAREKLLAELGG
jgi:hypothetical protein